MVDDAEALEPLHGLGGGHGRAVVGQEGARQTAFLKGLREGMDKRLRRFVQIPLEVAAKPRAVVEDAEQLRFLPLAIARQDGPRALVEVQVPEAVHVRDLVRACLARLERLAIRALAVTTLAGAQKALALHESAHRRVAGHRPEARVFAGERDEVVVMQLEAPARVVAVLARDRLDERGAQAWVRAGVRGHLAREHSQGIVGGASDVPPALEGLEREADRLARGGVPPRALGELRDARFELAVVGGGRQEGTEDLKTQTCPSHARAGRAVVVGHGSPSAAA